MKMVRGLQIPSKEKNLEFSKLTPRQRLEWLQETNEFVYAVSKGKYKVVKG